MGEPFAVHPNNDPTDVVDRHYTLDCPHCQARSGISAVSIPRWEFLDRLRPRNVGIAYCCDSCNEPIFLTFRVVQYGGKGVKNPIHIHDDPTEVQRPLAKFELQYLPPEVAEDFREALSCYSNLSFNTFGAMCRRSVQSASMVLGRRAARRCEHSPWT
jgi:hypothetical protein